VAEEGPVPPAAPPTDFAKLAALLGQLESGGGEDGEDGDARTDARTDALALLREVRRMGPSREGTNERT
jgi:hypothetical protein